MADRIFLIAGVLFGDECKGQTVDYLSRKHKNSLIIRHNGGPQCAHNVISPDGRHHTFRQFGSGMFNQGVHTHISEYMLIDPYAIFMESNFLNRVGVIDSLSRITVDENAVVITEYHKALNKIREISRGANPHGSCGYGIGETRKDSLNFPDKVLRAKHTINFQEAKSRLNFIKNLHKEEAFKLASHIREDDTVKKTLKTFDENRKYNDLENYASINMNSLIVNHDYLYDYLFSKHDTIIFEGAQGVLLDETHGFQPYVTWTDTTYGNAYKILKEYFGFSQLPWFNEMITRIGCIRPYMTRHGFGPLPHENEELKKRINEPHNKTGKFQGQFRFADLDLSLVNKSISILGGIDQIALSCVDHLSNLKSVKLFTEDTYISNLFNGNINVIPWLINNIQEETKVPIRTIGFGPTAKNRIEIGNNNA